MKKIDISIWSDSKEVYSTSKQLQSIFKSQYRKLNKKNKIKVYNLSVLAIACMNLNSLSNGRVELNVPVFNFMGWHFGAEFYVFIMLMILAGLTDPILSLLGLVDKNNKYSKGNLNLTKDGHVDISKAGYTDKDGNHGVVYKIITTILIITSCLLLLSIPFFMF